MRLLNTRDHHERFHVHIHVDDLAQSIAFIRGCLPPSARVKRTTPSGCWTTARELCDLYPGRQAGAGSPGFQVDDAAELAQLKSRAESADMALLDEGATSCCYARSESTVTDPQGVPGSISTRWAISRCSTSRAKPPKSVHAVRPPPHARPCRAATRPQRRAALRANAEASLNEVAVGVWLAQLRGHSNDLSSICH